MSRSRAHRSRGRAPHVLRALEIVNAKCFMYSDSQVALWWIRGSSSRWKTFVANRVSEIQTLSNSCSSQWRFCPGAENPADAISRGVSADRLSDRLWLQGPEWLTRQELPPVDNAFMHYGGEDGVGQAEMKVVALTTESSDQLINFDRFSKFVRLLRTIAWVLRFLSNCRSRKKQRGELSAEELAASRIQLFRFAQLEMFSQEMADLEKDKEIRYSKLYKLHPFMENGLIKMKSRLQFADLSHEEKFPIILPKGHVALLYVRALHFSRHHAGVRLLLVLARSEMWIVGLRQLAKRVVKECVVCQRMDSRPCEQPTAPLPAARVQRAPAFSVVGIDHAGPLFCADAPNVKFYILLFTCAVVRAVHLELVCHLSAESTVMAFRRFSARRGQPSCVYSDNARGFKAAAAELQTRIPQLEWRFIAPISPWWGGWWERLVRSTKSALRKTLGRRTLTEEQLLTVLLEVEACLNSRPLTCQTDEADKYNVITPAHFLIGRPFFVSVKDAEDPSDITSERLVERRPHQLAVTERFWTEWRLEYLRMLPSPASGRSNYRLKEGVLVLVDDASLPRQGWPLGVVVKCHPGRDGRVRAVDVRTTKGVLTRSVQKIRDLEVY